jgi:hypothetical protein
MRPGTHGLTLNTTSKVADLCYSMLNKLAGRNDPRKYRGAVVKWTIVTAINCISANGRLSLAGAQESKRRYIILHDAVVCSVISD